MKEDKIQAECFKWFHNNYCLKHHKPRCSIEGNQNEILSSVKKFIPNNIFIRLMAKFKAMGMKNGTSDIKVYLPKGKILFIEIKTFTGTQSDEQKDFENTVERLGFEYHICRSLEDFKEIIQSEL